MKYPGKDPWYFGDYLGGLPGNNYSLLLNSIIVLLLAQIALSTEPSLDTKIGDFYLDFALNLIELFFTQAEGLKSVFLIFVFFQLIMGRPVNIE